MYCLDPSQVKSWLARVNLGDAEFASGQLSGFTRNVCESVSRIGASETMFVARAMDAQLWVTEPPTCLVLVFEQGIWPSSENLSLYHCWRRAQGVNMPLDDARGHVFLPFERDHMASLVQMSVIFGWGIACVSGDGTAAYTIDHDGEVLAFGDTHERAACLAAPLSVKRHTGTT